MVERLQASGLEVQLLRTQYRMHPALAAWPSAAFYANQLLPHPTPADRQPPTGTTGTAAPPGPVLLLIDRQPPRGLTGTLHPPAPPPP